MVENIKENLDKRICDCILGATNTQTYREFIVEGWRYLGYEWSEKEVQELGNKSNEELDFIVDELEWLLSK